MGLVHRTMPDAELEGFIDGVAKTISENAPLSIANSKIDYRGVCESVRRNRTTPA